MVHASGLKPFAWGLRRPKHLRHATTLGIDAVFVDDLAERQ